MTHVLLIGNIGMLPIGTTYYQDTHQLFPSLDVDRFVISRHRRVGPRGEHAEPGGDLTRSTHRAPQDRQSGSRRTTALQ